MLPESAAVQWSASELVARLAAFFIEKVKLTIEKFKLIVVVASLRSSGSA